MEAGHEGAVATFQPEWPVLIAAKPSGKNKALPSPITAKHGRGSWNTSDSTLWLTASGCRKAALEIQRTRAPLPITSYHWG